MDVATLFIKSVLLVFSSISLLLYILLTLVNKLVTVDVEYIKHLAKSHSMKGSVCTHVLYVVLNQLLRAEIYSA